MSFTPNLNQPALKNFDTPGLCKAHPVEALPVKGVLDIASNFDVILFSCTDVLSKDGMVLPTAAVAMPQLRSAGKKLAVFTLEPSVDKDELLRHINYLGLSFSKNEMLLHDDLVNMDSTYPLIPNHRILMVCSNVMTEVTLAQAQKVTTLLITDKVDNQISKLGVWSNYISAMV